MSPTHHIVTLFALFSTGFSTCYWPTGNATYERDLTEHMPCSNDTTSPLATICCALNRTNPSGGDKIYGRTNDECLPNGICRNRVLDHGVMQVSYWRETCTSRDWKTGLCLDVCADDWSSGNGTTGAVMTPCDGRETSLKWCCGTSTDCCNDEKRVKVLPFEFRGAIPNTATASYNPFPTVTSSPSASSNNDNNNGGGLSTGAKAGIGVGAAIGGLFLLGLGFFIARKTGNKNHGRVATPEEQRPPVPEKVAYRHELEPVSRSELSYNPASPPPDRKSSPSYEMP